MNIKIENRIRYNFSKFVWNIQIQGTCVKRKNYIIEDNNI